MSLLGKYRKEERDKEDDDATPSRDSETSAATTSTTTTTSKVETPVAVPNKERKSPIMSFSVTSELRSCLQAVRNEKAINLSMWVERALRDAVAREFPDIANKHLE